MIQMQETMAAIAAGSLVVIAIAMLALCVKFTAAAKQFMSRPSAPEFTAPPALQPNISAAQAAAPPVNLNGVDEETAAMLMAITAHALGAAPDQLRFISIKEC